MSEPLAFDDLIADDDESSEIEDQPYFNMESDLAWFDPLEYHMRMPRGGLLGLPGDLSIKMRSNIYDAFFESFWILLPEDNVLEALLETLSEKTPWGPLLKAERYNYRLFYLEDHITFKDASGCPCKPGSTIITSTMHPSLTIVAANRFFLGKRPGFAKPRTGFNIQNKKDWLPSASRAFSCASAIKQTCSIQFLTSDRSLDKYRPFPPFWSDESKPTRGDTQTEEAA
ncbi:hypothetical protein H0H87_001993 [Tephrocybe sp. NHM501043]|nr:hypothetical protein H0H87_001993 [Tephrocybe sp. NHM501043]